MTMATAATDEKSTPRSGRPKWGLLALVIVLGGVIAVGVLALLVNIFTRQTEAQQPYFQVVELTDETYDPQVWGQNYPLQYEGWLRTQEMDPANTVTREPTAEDPRTVKTQSKLENDPRMVTMWQGYAFSVEYNRPRGHAYMLEDQRLVQRVTQFNQPGACLNCHASLPEIVNTMGDGDPDEGWAIMNRTPYNEATQFAQHPVACIDCHDPKTMELRVTRPAFVAGIKEYKAGQGIRDYDVNTQATAQEMRAYVCAQCHVEYYFAGEGKTLTFPWDHGLTADDALQYYDENEFSDFTHRLTGAPVVKAQHPDFETWSQGVHAQSGVTCVDCHMPYQREGAMKITDHQVASPMRSDASINSSCLTCHAVTEQEMRERVGGIQERYEHVKDTAFDALVQLIGDIETARTNGTDQARIEEAWAYQRKAQFFVDYVVSENSHGFHAPAYTNRLLADATDAARRGQLALLGQTYPAAGAPTPAPVPPYTPPPASPTPTRPAAPETASATP
ncbi:ammonia-forming cytochrome c nitrite reductase subunit c552 [Propioniciclava soli]|uniref:nitrite reductase (cytochrome; ammonia-forming) n=1 Tax=Propioniciclava soli TaxID=2775081 RepID=A0ABZ3C9K3_9ACTN